MKINKDGIDLRPRQIADQEWISHDARFLYSKSSFES